MGRENIYWMFSASAQAISALFAFLLAGFALVQAMMESAQERDDSLLEIHSRLQRDHYSRIMLLAVVAGAAIILSLLLVFFNSIGDGPSPIAILLVSLLDLAAIIGSIWFVVWIINPQKYRHAAKGLVEEEKQQMGLPPPTGDPHEFFAVFVRLETTVRRILQRKKLYVPSLGAPRMSYSFRQMIDALYRNGIIAEDLYQELQQINKYRNIIFHGHEDRVDELMLRKTKAALSQVSKLEKGLRLTRKSTSRRITR